MERDAFVQASIRPWLSNASPPPSCTCAWLRAFPASGSRFKPLGTFGNYDQIHDGEVVCVCIDPMTTSVSGMSLKLLFKYESIVSTSKSSAPS